MLVPLLVGGGILLALALAGQNEKVEKLDPNVADPNARAFNDALKNNRDPAQLRQFVMAAIALGAPNYARALLTKSLLLEGVPQNLVTEQVERMLQNPPSIQRGPVDRGGPFQPQATPAPAPGTAAPEPPPPQGLPPLATTQPVPERPPGPQPAPAPGVFPPSAPPPLGAAESARQIMQRALEDNTVQGLTTGARILENMGFPSEAEQLRQRAREIVARTPAPPHNETPSATIDPQMPPGLAQEVAKQLQHQGDPVVLRQLAVMLRRQGFGNTADLLDAKAAQIETAIEAGRVLKDVQDIVKKEEGLVKPSPQPGGGVPIRSPGQPTAPPPPKKPREQGRAPAPQAPDRPRAGTPAPQPSPEPRSPAEIAARNMMTHLHQVVDTHGFPAAEGKEDKFLVEKFQRAAGLKIDGNYGPGTALAAANAGADDISIVFEWPRGSTQKTVRDYRGKLREMAAAARSRGKNARAEALEFSAGREKGQSGVAGGPLRD
jgi:hypothetical protein